MGDHRLGRSQFSEPLCHQTLPTNASPALEENLKANKARNPDIEFKLYDDGMIEHFFAHQHGRAVVDAYHRINPKFGAARADFFRYFQSTRLVAYILTSSLT